MNEESKHGIVTINFTVDVVTDDLDWPAETMVKALVESGDSGLSWAVGGWVEEFRDIKVLSAHHCPYKALIDEVTPEKAAEERLLNDKRIARLLDEIEDLKTYNMELEEYEA